MNYIKADVNEVIQKTEEAGKDVHIKNEEKSEILTCQLPWVTKIEFPVTILTQYQADKEWEERQILIREILVDPIPYSPNWLSKNWYDRQWGKFVIRSWEWKSWGRCLQGSFWLLNPLRKWMHSLVTQAFIQTPQCQWVELKCTPLSCVFVVAYGKYLLKAAQQVYSTTQRERDIKFIIFKRTYFVESFQREPNSLWSTFDHQLHNFVTNGISTDEHTFPKK